jgi:hypothetical protein
LKVVFCDFLIVYYCEVGDVGGPEKIAAQFLDFFLGKKAAGSV